MNKEDIIRMYVKANGWSPEGFDNTVKELERFAELVAAAEREACAKVCDAECNPTPNEGNITTYQSGGYITAEYLAAAIRARGQK
jgi:hypothetical protein